LIGIHYCHDDTERGVQGSGSISKNRTKPENFAKKSLENEKKIGMIFSVTQF
jgi:hypothetical protein